MASELRCSKPGCGALKIVGKPCTDADCPQQWVHHTDTRPAPAATDTGLEIDIEATAENIARSMSNYKNSGRLHGPTYEVAKAAAIVALTCASADTRSQAVELLAAERTDLDRALADYRRCLVRITELQADNAALTARIKELELQLSASKETAKIKRVEYLDLDQDHSELKADYAVSEAQLKAVRKALEATHEAISEYYRYQTGGEMRGSYDGKPERNALWKSMYQARAVLGGKPS